MKALPSGSYFLNLVLLNEANEAQVEQYKKFFVFNPSIVVEQEPASTLGGTFETSEYAVMPEEEVNKSFEHIAVVAAESERRRIDQFARSRREATISEGILDGKGSGPQHPGE